MVAMGGKAVAPRLAPFSLLPAPFWPAFWDTNCSKPCSTDIGPTGRPRPIQKSGRVPTAQSSTRNVTMLVLSRLEGESLVIGDNIRVTILEVDGSRIRVGIEAPRDIQVWREELLRDDLAESALRGAA
jgi:carbon storage regulator